jgi:hypothetical protein
MYEIIWSTWNDAYIIRPVCPYSSIKPEFIGSLEECKEISNQYFPIK